MKMRIALFIFVVTGFAFAGVDPVMNGNFQYDGGGYGSGFYGSFLGDFEGTIGVDVGLTYHYQPTICYGVCDGGSNWVDVTYYTASGSGEAGAILYLPEACQYDAVPDCNVITFETSHAFGSLQGWYTLDGQGEFTDQYYGSWWASGYWSNGWYSTMQGEAFWNNDEGGHGDFDISTTATPEPSTLLLLGSGLLGAMATLRKGQR